MPDCKTALACRSAVVKIKYPTLSTLTKFNTILFSKALVKQGWLWQEALLLTLPIATVCALLGLFIGLAIDLLAKQSNTSPARRLRLWYRACQDLRLPSATLEQTVGKGTLLLLAAQEQEKRGE